MFFALGAASSAIDLLSSLASPSSSSSTTGKSGIVPAKSFSLTDPTATSTSTTSGGANGAQLSPSTWNTLLAAQSQGQTGATSRSAALNDLFSQIDGNGDGQITKTEFENTLGAGGTNLQMADDVFNKMDLNGDGSISKDEMSQALEKGGRHHHRHHAGGAGNADALMQALQGATSTSSTNGDGSTTTTLTYADGTKITMTQPAAGSSSTTSASNNAIQSYNFTERLIERQAQWFAANAQSSLSMSV